jgi:hypothetical protein
MHNENSSIFFLPNLSHKFPVTKRANVLAKLPTIIMKPMSDGSNCKPPAPLLAVRNIARYGKAMFLPSEKTNPRLSRILI